MNLPEFAVRRPTTVMMIFLAIALMGAISLSMLNIDLLPEIEPPAISVLVPYPGATASDVESDVTKYLEDQLSTVNNLDKLISLSKDNLAMVTCKFAWGTDLDVASNDVRDKIDLAKPDIHEHAPDAEEPMLFKFSSATAPVMFVTVTATESWPQLYHLVDKRISDPLKRVPGVGAIMMYGGMIRQINVEFDKRALAGYGLTVPEVIQKIKAENLDMPAGDVKMGTRRYQIRLTGRFTSPEEIASIIVGTQEGRLVHLRDVADVSDSFEEPTMYGWGDGGQRAVVMIIQKQTGANTVAVCRGIRKRLAELQKDLPSDVQIAIPMDNSEFILWSIENLAQTLLIAGILVVVVTVLFLRRFRASVIIALTIPFSLITAFIFLFLKGYTINVVSLMSLSIAIGMVVDNAIVILENITRHIEEGQRPREAAVFGAAEVGTAVMASTLTTVAVFLPLVFVSGLSGIVFDQLAFVVSITLVGSLFAAVTLTPMLASKWIRPIEARKTGRLYRFSERGFQAVERAYERLLHGALRHRWKVLVVLAVIFAGSLYLLRFMGTDLFPDVDEGTVNIRVSLDESARLEESAAVAKRIGGIYRGLAGPYIAHEFAFCGETKEGIGVALGFEEGANQSEGGVRLVKKKDRPFTSKDLAARIRDKVARIPGIHKMKVTAGAPMKQVLLGGGKQIEVEIIGHDMDVTNRLAEQVRKIFERTPGAVDVSISRKKPRQEVHVVVDRQKAASLGVNVATVAQVLRSNYYGFEASKYRDAGDDFDIFVRLKESERRNLDDIGEVDVPSMDENVKSVKLKNIARIEYSTGPVQIDRKNRERIVKVGADTYGRSLGEVRADVERELKKLKIPPGVTLDFGGEVEEQQKAFRDLTLLLAVGVILVYMVMASQFESLRLPFVIAFALPFAFTGVIWAFYLTGVTLNLMSFMAGIMLVGVVVNNAIVLIDYTNILRARGIGLKEAVAQAGRHRLRPVLMTTLTTVFGMLPLALSRGEGSEMWQPFGITAIGGLSLSALVTLILVPIIYSLFEARSERKAAAKGKTS